MSTEKHPTQSRDKHADVAHMLADLIGVSAAYDSTHDAWMAVANDYDHLAVTIDFLETSDRAHSTEVYRLTLERVK
jgi:hypothetical protein